jgi:2-polyprenyl-3-methyl-5-hydroxy-6-metoxy-1,4-benzoquinol methylase
MSPQQPAPLPTLFFETVNAYQRTAALQAAIELDVFTAIGEGNRSPAQLAARCGVAERGVRILCDYLTVIGFLTKQDGCYSLTPDSAAFCDRRSRAYLGGVLDFLLMPDITHHFQNLAHAVRKGGTADANQGTMAPEHPMWVKFAHTMGPMMGMTAQLVAQHLALPAGRRCKVLDIAAGHGLYGIALAQNNPGVELVALDWPNVLEVARENAQRAGLGPRFGTIAGSAFDAPLGSGYDLVLLANFLHHFDPPTCETLLRRVRDALAPDGRVVTVEFVPNEDRVSPPPTAGFAIIMLASTLSGDAYTFRELDQMLRNAGFAHNTLHALAPSTQSVIVSAR